MGIYTSGESSTGILRIFISSESFTSGESSTKIHTTTTFKVPAVT
jgi:hypothetical protein